MKSKFRIKRDVVEDILDAETWCQWAISVGLHHVAFATYLSIHVTNTGKQLIGAPAADASSGLCSNDFMSSCISRRCGPSRMLAMAPQSASFESIVWTPARIVIAYPCSTILSLQQLRLAARDRIYFSPTLRLSDSFRSRADIYATPTPALPLSAPENSVRHPAYEISRVHQPLPLVPRKSFGPER